MGLHFINAALLIKKEATNDLIVVKYLKTASGPESTFFVRVLINGSDLLTPSVRPCNKSDSTCTIKGLYPNMAHQVSLRECFDRRKTICSEYSSPTTISTRPRRKLH